MAIHPVHRCDFIISSAWGDFTDFRSLDAASLGGDVQPYNAKFNIIIYVGETYLYTPYRVVSVINREKETKRRMAGNTQYVIIIITIGKF